MTRASVGAEPRSRALSLVLVWVLLAGGFVWLDGPGAAHADDEDGELSVKEMRSRRSKLRAAGGRYITHRKRFPSTCPRCKGSGKTAIRRPRYTEWINCQQCEGAGVWVSRKDYRIVYYDMRSPAFKAIPGIKDALGKQYDLVRRGRPWPLRIKRYRIHDWEMVGTRHGIVWMSFNGGGVPFASYWVLAYDERKKKLRWFIYSPHADGPWPEEGEAATPEGSGSDDAGGYTPLTPSRAAALRSAVASARVTFRVVEGMEQGNTLYLRLEPGTDSEGRFPSARVKLDVVKLVRAIFSRDTPWNRVESEWQDEFIDEYGRKAQRIRWVSGMGRSAHDGADWNNTSLPEQAALANITEMEYEGWTPCDPAEPKAAEKPPQGHGPTITEDDGPVEPTPSGGDEPPPTGGDVPPSGGEAPKEPTPTAPPPTVEPPPTAPVIGELPTLTSKAKRKAKEGLAKIKTLMAAATKAFNEGQLAHKGGAPDVWQEKLSEARGYLGEIQDVWMEDIVEHMPGVDEAEKDAVANEHFGEVWDEVYKLKSMVNKMSRGG